MFQSVVEAIFHHSKATPHKLCLADDTKALSYSEYACLILKYASCLKSLKIGGGDRVVAESCQTVDYLALQQALQLIGGVFVPVEHNCAESKIQGFAQRCDAKLIITEKPLGDYTYSQLSEMAEGASPLEDYTFPSKETVCELLFSTGTTGKEKGITLIHQNNVALAENVIHGVKMQEDNVEMIPSPMNHSHGLRRYYANMVNGSSVVLLGSVMNIRRFFGAMDEFKVNSIDLVPAALTVILKLSKDLLGKYADQLRYIQYGSAPLAQQDVERVCALLPHTRMYNFYGSTESGCTCIYDFNDPDAKKSCIGKPTYNVDLRFADDDRNFIEASRENPGCIATAGGMNMLGYWGDAEETQKVLEGGFVFSNDLGYMDEDGDVILMGRKGDVINIGGIKVSPDEIENAAKKMEGVADCGCIPVPHEAKGQVPKLFVQMSRGAEFDPKAIRSFLAHQLEPQKVPEYIEEIAKIPRSFNGKLLRKELH